MANFVEFKGLKHYPLGNCQLAVVGDNLQVSGFSDTGLDGVSIEVNAAKEWDATIAPIQFNNNNVASISHLGQDEDGRVKTLAEQAMYIDSDSGRCKFAFNSKLFGQQYTLVGMLNGEVTFEKEYNTPDYDPNANWVWVAVAIGLYVLDHADFKYSTTTNSDGTSSTTKEVSWNGKAASGGDDGDTFEDQEGEVFHADRLYLRTTVVEDTILVNQCQLVNVRCKNIDTLRISDEVYHH